MDGWMDELATMGFVELPVCEQPAPRDRSHRWAITDRLIYYSFNENSQTFSKRLSNFIQQEVKAKTATRYNTTKTQSKHRLHIQTVVTANY